MSKIKNDAVYGEFFDILPLNASDEGSLIYILNKAGVLEVIERNKDIYTLRMGLAEDVAPNIIYEELINNKGRYLNSHYCSSYQDIVGLTLGYPRYSSMVFQLEKMFGIDGVKQRGNPKLYKKMLLDVLYGEKSPYKNLDKNILNTLEDVIKSYKEIRKSENKYYEYVKFAEEPLESQRINIAAEEFVDNFDVADLF